MCTLILLALAVVIGFADSNMSVAVIEGNPPQTVYIGVNQEGLALDTFDTIPINIQTTFGKVSSFIVSLKGQRLWST